jgi:hypothetical protein
MRILHLADFHLPGSPGKLLHGVNPYANLAEAVAVIRKQIPAPDLSCWAATCRGWRVPSYQACWTCSRI